MSWPSILYLLLSKVTSQTTSFFLYVIIFFAAPAIADFYDMDIIRPILRVLGLRLLISGVNSIQRAWIQKRMLFRRFFVSTSFGTVISAVVGISMAYRGMAQVGNGNPLLSGASYGGFVILWFAAFLAEIGSKNNLKNVNLGMLLSVLFIFGAASVCCVALIGHINVTAAADIPALVLAGQISPILAQIFAIIICAGIYTSAVPLLWTGVRKVSNEGTKKYRIITIAGGVIGCIVACFIPYKGLINVLYGMNGYLGFVLIFFMLVYDTKTKMSRKVKC